MNLFITLYLDEDVDIQIAALLRGYGFAAVTARDAGQLQKSDAGQLAYVVLHQFTLMTHNRADFEDLAQEYYANTQQHYGVILAVRHPPHEIVRRLLLILNHVTADEMQNQLRYI